MRAKFILSMYEDTGVNTLFLYRSVQKMLVDRAKRGEDVSQNLDILKAMNPRKLTDEEVETLKNMWHEPEPQIEPEPELPLETEPEIAHDELDPGIDDMGEKKINEIVRKRGDKWVVLTHDGKKVLGTHDSEAAAEKQLDAIHASQHARG